MQQLLHRALKPTLAFLTTWTWIAALLGQAPVFSGKDPNTNEAEFALVAAIKKDLCIGDVVTFTFKGKVNVEGWHLYSSRTDGNIAYNPTQLEFFPEECKGVKLKGPMTENAKADEVYDDLLMGQVRSFHEKQVDFTQKIEVTGKEIVLSGQLSAQTCTSDGMCKFLKLPISWKMSLSPNANCPTGGVSTPGDSTPVGSVDTLAPAVGSFSFTAYDSTLSLNDNVRAQERLHAGLYGKMDSAAACAFYDPAQALAYGKHVGRPVLLYFTALADAESRKMEQSVLKSPVVDSILRYRVVLARFYVDAKDAAPAGTKLGNGNEAGTLGAYYADYEQQHFGGANHPLFALADEAGRKYGESIGVTDVGQFSGWLKGAITEFYSDKGRAEAAWLPKSKAVTPGGDTGEGEGGCGPVDLLWIFLQAMGGGFLALLTPCVFPMIPMTVSFFVKQGEDQKRGAGLRNAFTYAFSIVFIYAIVGFFISVFLPPDTLYRMGSAVVPNAIFFAIFLAFALSFFGLFEITLPSSWSSAMSNKAGAGGMLGPFFMALTLVIVSFSCTGPILGTAIVQASSGSVCKWNPFVAFLGFGVAFAIPFGLLAIFPRLLEKLPMAGGWMNTVKVVFGFLELALCMKFLSNVDLVMHWHLLDRSVFLGIWIVIFLMLGIYLLGWITLPHDDKVERVSVGRLLMAIGSFSFVMYMVPGLWGAPLQALEGLIPPTTKNVGVKLLPHQVEGGGGAGAETLNGDICKSERKYAHIAEDRESHGLCMFYDLDQAMAFAKEKNKPLFLDFTGHTCANCRKMENGVWPDPKIMTMLQNDFVTVSLYADENNNNFDPPKLKPDGKPYRSIGSWVTEYQRMEYGLISQPYYVLMDYDGTDLLPEKGVGYTPNVDEYHAFLKRGVEVFKQRHGIAGE